MSKKKQKNETPMMPVEIKRTALWKWIAGAVVFVAAISGGYWFYSHRTPKPAVITQPASPQTPEESLKSLAEKNFPGAEKPVSEKLGKLWADVKQKPSSGESWGKLAMNLDVHDYKEEALFCYQKASELSAQDYHWPYYRAVLLQEKKSKEALTYFQKSLTLNDSNVAGHIRYGQALLDEQRYDDAAKEFVRATKLNPNVPHAYVGLAKIALIQNQVQTAGSLLKRAIEINPRQGEAYALFNEVFLRLNEPKKAKEQLYISQQLPETTPLQDELFRELMQEGVSSKFHYLRGRAMLSRGDLKNAEQEFIVAAQNSPDVRYQDSLGITYLYEKKYQDAIAAHRKAIALDPKSITSMNNLAAALFEAGQKNEAIKVLQDAIQKDPQVKASYRHLASLQARSGNLRGAMDAYRLGLKNLPEDPLLSVELGWLLATSADPSMRNGVEAVQLVEPVARKTPDAQTLDILAIAYAEAGQFDRAIAIEKQAMKIAGSKEGSEVLKTHLKLFQAKRRYPLNIDEDK